MPAPKISIVVPVYNVAEYLEIALGSVLAQTEPDFEIIAINDASTDNSLTLLHAIAATDVRVKVFDRPVNAGLAATRNFGLLQATGDWIAFLDSDDFLEPDTLKIWWQQAQDQSVDVLIGNAYRFSEDTEIRHGNLLAGQPWGQQLAGRQWIVSAVEMREWPHYAWLQLLRRSFVLKHGFTFNESIVHEDILWTLGVALVAERMGFCEQPFYGYRINLNSITGSASEASVMRRANSYVVIIDTLLNEAFAQNKDPLVKKALLTQGIRECGHLLGLMRKRLTNKERKAELAVVVMEKRFVENLFLWVSTLSQFALMMRFSWLLLKYLPARKSFSAHVLRLGVNWLLSRFSPALLRK